MSFNSKRTNPANKHQFRTEIVRAHEVDIGQKPQNQWSSTTVSFCLLLKYTHTCAQKRAERTKCPLLSIQISVFGFVWSCNWNEDGKHTQRVSKISHEILEFWGINSRIYEHRVFAAEAATKRQMCYMLWQYGEVMLLFECQWRMLSFVSLQRRRWNTFGLSFSLALTRSLALDLSECAQICQCIFVSYLNRIASFCQSFPFSILFSTFETFCHFFCHLRRRRLRACHRFSVFQTLPHSDLIFILLYVWNVVIIFTAHWCWRCAKDNFSMNFSSSWANGRPSVSAMLLRFLQQRRE